MTDIQVRFISPEDVIPIRHEVLRQGHPVEACRFPNDCDEGAFHLGAFSGGELAAVVSFHIESTPAFPVPGLTCKLRGMATRPEYRRRGLARAMVLRAEEILKERGAVGWWCHAREAAFGFYLSMGLVFHGEMFVEEDIGPHRLMLRPF